jgi:hypothetical protein
MKMESRLTGRFIKIELAPEGTAPPPAVLIVEYSIDCPECGQHTVRLAGHHARALRNLLIEAIDLHPELCGEESGIEVVERLQFGLTPPKDPGRN